jgi:hypothetical protein
MSAIADDSLGDLIPHFVNFALFITWQANIFYAIKHMMKKMLIKAML